MRIKCINLIDFGALSNKKIFFQNGFNFIYGINEAGKSTIKNSVDAILYGFIESEARRKIYTDNYYIYKHGDYKLSMELEHEGSNLLIERYMNEERCLVFDSHYNEISDNYKSINKIKVPGVDILGVSPETYREIYTIDTEKSFENKINLSLAYNLRSEDVFEEALKKIGDRLNEIGSDRAYTKDRVLTSNKIDKINSEILEQEKKLIKIDEYYKERESLDNEQRALDKKIKALDTRLKDIEDSMLIKPDSAKTPYKHLVTVSICIFLLLSFYLSYKYSFIYVILSMGIVIYLLYFLKSTKSEEKIAYERISKEILELGKQKNTLIHTYQQVQERKAFIEGLIYDMNKTKALILEKKDQLLELYTRKESLDREYFILEQAYKAIEEANSKFKKGSNGRVKQKAKEIFETITKKDELVLKDDFDFYLNKGTLIDSSKISKGTIETLVFSIKMAFNINISKNDFLIFDDAFLSLDDERLNRVAEILYEVSKQKQILFFTSNKRMLEIFEKKGYDFHEVIF